ncbi:phosphopantetheine-binding protein [Micromonospora sp. DR5-3]|uniref:phosphopantetheine-binding protein n=1 Tax=Micromonospora sp. DR5-3 TaxID=2992129 RepID=UPI00222F314B|nr:phosphopantetheine-binding protein [Micromonospora sp. DR5-3]MCW3818945.1 phosphopantetheine-binding protein [Micromonospora sp. DR5-3]
MRTTTAAGCWLGKLNNGPGLQDHRDGSPVSLAGEGYWSAGNQNVHSAAEEPIKVGMNIGPTQSRVTSRSPSKRAARAAHKQSRHPRNLGDSSQALTCEGSSEALEPRREGERLMATAAIQNVRDVLAVYPGLADVAVLAHEHESVGQVLVAYVVPGSSGLNLAELHKYVRKQLPGSAVPAAIMVVDAIPVNSAGMAEPHALPAPDLRGVMPYRPPDTPRQEALCTIFAEVLARPRCGVDDNFFTLGGESIDAMLIASRASAIFGQDISMDDLFDAPTVAELDRLLDLMPLG